MLGILLDVISNGVPPAVTFRSICPNSQSPSLLGFRCGSARNDIPGRVHILQKAAMWRLD